MRIDSARRLFLNFSYCKFCLPTETLEKADGILWTTLAIEIYLVYQFWQHIVKNLRTIIYY